MKIRKLISVTTAVFVMALFVSACGSQETGAFDTTTLVDAIGSAPENGLRLSDAFSDTPTFDRAVIVCPFTMPEQIREAVGTNWSGATQFNTADETVNSLVFVQGKDVVGTLTAKRVSLNLCSASDAGGSQLLAGDQLSFVQELNTDGTAAWTLAAE